MIKGFAVWYFAKIYIYYGLQASLVVTWGCLNKVQVYSHGSHTSDILKFALTCVVQCRRFSAVHFAGKPPANPSGQSFHSLWQEVVRCPFHLKYIDSWHCEQSVILREFSVLTQKATLNVWCWKAFREHLRRGLAKGGEEDIHCSSSTLKTHPKNLESRWYHQSSISPVAPSVNPQYGEEEMPVYIF